MFYFSFIKFLGTSLNSIFWLIIKRAVASNNKKEKQNNKDKMLVTPNQNVPQQNNTDLIFESELKKNN